MGLVLKILRPFVWLTCRLLFRMKFHGVENIPPTGACIIAPNHVTFVDPIWITIPFRRPIYYMAWDKPFDIPVLGALMRAFGAFPLNLERIDSAAQRGARARLSEGCALVIFPEGGRSRTGRVEPFKMGAFRLALTHGVPIVPVTIVGGYEVWPAGQLLPKPWGRISITYHPAIAVEPLPEGVSKTELRTRAHSLAKKTRDSITGETREAFVKALEARGWYREDKTIYAPHRTMGFSELDFWLKDVPEFRQRMEERMDKIKSNKHLHTDQQQHQNAVEDAEGLISAIEELTTEDEERS